jgi:hypothetical protein
MDYARSNMAIIDAPLVNIEIPILSDNRISKLRLNYHEQRYDLVQAFASHKLELAQQRWQQQIAVDRTVSDQYLLVREVGYYSLWVLDQSVSPTSKNRASNHNLALQQASIWLFQELWLQWQDLLGERQLQLFTDNLLAANSLLRSKEDLNQLLILDPLSSEQLANWESADLIRFDRQLCNFTQKKMGQQFGNKLMIDIIESMPDLLRTILMDNLDLEIQSNIPQHD